MAQAFSLGVLDVLKAHETAILNTIHHTDGRPPPQSLLELAVLVNPLLLKLEALARLCRLLRDSPRPVSRSATSRIPGAADTAEGLSTAARPAEAVLCNFREMGRRAVIRFPRGAELLTHLHRVAERSTETSLAASWAAGVGGGGEGDTASPSAGIGQLFRTLFVLSLRPYMRLAADWVFRGEASKALDPHGEFMVRAVAPPQATTALSVTEIVTARVDRGVAGGVPAEEGVRGAIQYERRGGQTVPEFLRGRCADDIWECGMMQHHLRSCSPPVHFECCDATGASLELALNAAELASGRVVWPRVCQVWLWWPWTFSL